MPSQGNLEDAGPCGFILEDIERMPRNAKGELRLTAVNSDVGLPAELVDQFEVSGLTCMADRMKDTVRLIFVDLIDPQSGEVVAMWGQVGPEQSSREMENYLASYADGPVETLLFGEGELVAPIDASKWSRAKGAAGLSRTDDYAIVGRSPGGPRATLAQTVEKELEDESR